MELKLKFKKRPGIFYYFMRFDKYGSELNAIFFLFVIKDHISDF